MHVTHCGGLSAYNTAAERLNASETRAIVNIPISASAYGPARNADGSFNEEIAHANLQWELDELEVRLGNCVHCERDLQTLQAASITGCRTPRK